MIAGERCTFPGAPMTVHVVKRELVTVDGAVETRCGRYGWPRPVAEYANRECHKCREVGE